MKNFQILPLFCLLVVLLSFSCKNIVTYNENWNRIGSKRDFDEEIVIPQFNFKQTVSFEDSLSTYAIYSGDPADLIPTDNFHLLELSSALFTDYASKQRLIKLPAGSKLQALDLDKFDFPDQTILAKTFYYHHDFQKKELGKRIIETRLLIKAEGHWNAATYVWNQDQTEAYLLESGEDTQVSWLDNNGVRQQTEYHIPSKNECATCHQSNSEMMPIGPRIRNLNRTVIRKGQSINQLDHLAALKLLTKPSPEQRQIRIADYQDSSQSLAERSRAYLDMNCAHCHSPNAWKQSGQRRFDFRFEIPLEQTGMLAKPEKVERTLKNGKMPLIGTSMIDREGVQFISKYLETLD